MGCSPIENIFPQIKNQISFIWYHIYLLLHYISTTFISCVNLCVNICVNYIFWTGINSSPQYLPRKYFAFVRNNLLDTQCCTHRAKFLPPNKYKTVGNSKNIFRLLVFSTHFYTLPILFLILDKKEHTDDRGHVFF